MTHNLEALARALVASPWWRWMDGMVTRSGRRLSRSGERSIPPLGALPDLTDPATLGCLLALVREAWGRPAAYVRWSALEGIWICMIKGYPPHAADSEAAALVAALLAAP